MANILLIDDDAMLREMFKQGLEKYGHRVFLAADGDAGLAAQKSTVFDLVITDLIMPGKEGIETIMELRRRSPRLKIIAMSGGGQGTARNYLELAGKLGANRTLTKPFAFPELSATIAEVLQED